MAQLELADISKKMRKLDICMMVTQNSEDVMTSRPMSNNADVEYDGNSWFFSYEEAEVVKELKGNANVNLNFIAHNKLFISISGKAVLSTDINDLEAHWIDELEEWFTDGVNTPGITLLHVKADTIKYWEGRDLGEVKV